MQKKRELPESVKPVLKEVKILSGFSDAEIEKISANCMVTEYHAGDIIMEENTPASEIFIVLKGRVSIYQGPKTTLLNLLNSGRVAALVKFL